MREHERNHEHKAQIYLGHALQLGGPTVGLAPHSDYKLIEVNA